MEQLQKLLAQYRKLAGQIQRFFARRVIPVSTFRFCLLGIKPMFHTFCKPWMLAVMIHLRTCSTMYYEWHKFMQTTSCAVTRHDICSLASKVYSRALLLEDLHSAFKKTSIYSFYLAVISRECTMPAEVYRSLRCWWDCKSKQDCNEWEWGGGGENIR